jgi:YVTN family beta-propeller protein
VWVTTPGDDLVSRVDPRTGNVVQIAVGRSPQGIAAGREGVFVANRTSNSVTRIDPRTSRPVGEPVPVALNPYAVAIGDGSVWVACTSENAVVRIRL